MASLFRPQYTRNGIKNRVKVWWGQWRDAAGNLHRQSLETTNRGAAQLKLADLVRTAAAPADKRPIAEHIDGWRDAMHARSVDAVYVRLVINQVRRVADACVWQTLAAMNATDATRVIESWRGPRHAKGISAKTANDYRESLRSFVRWLHDTGRLPRVCTPLAGLRNVSTRTDRRHDRRPLSEDELCRLFASTAASPAVAWDMSGVDRYHLYLAACATGFRKKELRSLTPESFRFDDVPPVVVLAAGNAKNRKPTRQPLPADMVPVLRAYVASRPAGMPLWGSAWRGANMLRRDLVAAGIPYVVDGPDGPLFADFHALRHSYIALLDQPGVSLKQAMQLARHSDPRLTMRIYGKADIHKLAAAVDTVPLADLLAHPLTQATDGDRQTVARIDAPACATILHGSAPGSTDCAAAAPCTGDGIAHRWQHGFFAVHAPLLCLLLALAAAAFEPDVMPGPSRRAA